MRESARFCDICATEGLVRLAYGWHWGSDKQYDVCREHLNGIKKYIKDGVEGLAEGGEYKFRGDMDPDLFLA